MNAKIIYFSLVFHCICIFILLVSVICASPLFVTVRLQWSGYCEASVKHISFALHSYCCVCLS